MATPYNPFTWAAGTAGGTLVTAARLNNLEQAAALGTAIAATTIIVKGPGVDPTGATDSTTAVQAMWDEAQNTGKWLFFPAGTFLVELVSNKEVDQPLVIGCGKLTILEGKGAGTKVIDMPGTSGQASFGRIMNLTITNVGGTCIEVSGAIGVGIIDVHFNGAEYGVVWHNKVSGDYTEFCWTENCVFRQGVKTMMEYRVTAGDPSFHGTGFKNTVFNQTDASWGNEAIIVGAGSNVYNAPWDGKFFIGTRGLPPIRNNSSVDVKCHGTITVEGRPGISAPIVNNSSAGRVYLQGGLNRLASNGGVISKGIRLYLVDDVSYYGTLGRSSHHKKPYETDFDLNSGTTTVFEPTIDSQPSYLVACRITNGGSYTYQHLLYITLNNSGTAGEVDVVSSGFHSDSGAIGAPSFGMSGKNLTITRTGLPAGTKAYFKVSPLHARVDFPLV